MAREATLWNRKGNESQRNELLAALAVLIDRDGGEVIIQNSELIALDGSVGIRARYLPCGGLQIWTYDLVEDMKGLIDGYR
jgi:hypothetical protein